jgi:glycine cleavage system H lipoate-binding protein
MTVLFVVATIILFLGIDWIVRRIRGETLVPLLASPQPATYPVRTPEGIFFAKSHTWLNLFPSGSVRLGIDDFVGRMLENPEITLLKKNGDAVTKGEPIMVLKENNHTLTIRSPFEGTIVGMNEELPAHPEWLKDRLFSDGWGYVIKPKDTSILKAMLLGKEIREWVREEFSRLRDVFAGIGAEGTPLPAFLQDGGPPVATAMKQMDDRIWKTFEQTFLSVE